MKWRRRVMQGLALLAFAAVPAVLCQYLAEPPQDRYIHMESFRYGKEPSVIRCNRGDRLHLTFSTRDTGHSFFLEEMDIDAKISPGSRTVEAFRTSDPEAPANLTEEVVLRAGHPGWLNYLVSKSQYRCHVWCGPMHAFEHGNLVIWPNTLLFAALGLLVGIPVVSLASLRSTLKRPSLDPDPVAPTDGWDLFRAFPLLKRLMKLRGFQFAFQAVAMALFYVVILTTLFGVLVAGRNLGIMLLWVVWLFVLTAVLTPFGGRIWCMACPLPMLGEAMQRRSFINVRTGSTNGTNNRFFGLNRRWPQWLSNAWPRMLLFLGMGTCSTLLVANPRASAYTVVAMFVAGIAMALIWELRAFCRYICPINSFVGLYSSAGKLALRSANPAICAKCKVRTCLNGNEKGWACPYGLCVGDMNENAECGLCTECIKSCAYDNVTLRCRPFARETKLRGLSEAFLSLVMLVLAASYCIVHLGHWPIIRDYVNVLDKKNWDLFGIFAAVVWGTALIVLPGIVYALAYLGKRLAGLATRTRELFIASAGPLVPVGLMLWVAFVIPMFSVSLTFVWQSLSDPFGWGWNFFGGRAAPWHQLWPRALPWLQVGAMLLGLGYGLRNAWRVWLEQTHAPRAALRGMLPLAALILGICGYFVWFFAN